MNWKIILSIIALLAIGFIAGFSTHRYMSKQMVKKIAVLRQTKGMENRLYETLKLEEAQKETLTPIIQSHLEKLAELQTIHKMNRVKVVDDMKQAIMPHLNEKQQKQLEKFSRVLKRNRNRGQNKNSKKKPAKEKNKTKTGLNK